MTAALIGALRWALLLLGAGSVAFAWVGKAGPLTYPEGAALCALLGFWILYHGATAALILVLQTMLGLAITDAAHRLIILWIPSINTLYWLPYVLTALIVALAFEFSRALYRQKSSHDRVFYSVCALLVMCCAVRDQSGNALSPYLVELPGTWTLAALLLVAIGVSTSRRIVQRRRPAL